MAKKKKTVTVQIRIENTTATDGSWEPVIVVSEPGFRRPHDVIVDWVNVGTPLTYHGPGRPSSVVPGVHHRAHVTAQTGEPLELMFSIGNFDDLPNGHVITILHANCEGATAFEVARKGPRRVTKKKAAAKKRS